MKTQTSLLLTCLTVEVKPKSCSVVDTDRLKLTNSVYVCFITLVSLATLRCFKISRSFFNLLFRMWGKKFFFLLAFVFEGIETVPSVFSSVIKHLERLIQVNTLIYFKWQDVNHLKKWSND